MKRILLLLITASALGHPGHIPSPGDPEHTNTNGFPAIVTQKQIPRNGAIHRMDSEVIEWWNLSNRCFTVEHRLKLTDGSWTNIGEGYEVYQHDNPEGFYRVIESKTDVVFPVWNSGTTNLVWTASSTSALDRDWETRS